MYLLLGLLLAACQSDPNKLNPETEISAQIDGRAWSARPTITRRTVNSLGLEGEQRGKGYISMHIFIGGDLDKPFTAEFGAGSMEVLNPSALQVNIAPDTYMVNIVYVNRETGESWTSMRPAEGSGGQLVVTKAERNYLEGEFSGTLWGPIRPNSEAWKDPRNLRPLKVEKGVIRVQLAD